MNFLDRTIAIFSPKTAYQRAAYRAALGTVASSPPAAPPKTTGSKRGFRAWNVSSANADGNLLPILEDVRARSRDLYEHNPIAGGAVNTMVTNIIGSGLRLHPHIDRELLGMTEEQAEAWERKTLREWKMWSGSSYCDASLHDDFAGLQALALLSMLVAGDVLVTLPWLKRTNSPYDLRVQIIEGDRLVQPYSKPPTDDFAGGIETDAHGAPRAYHFAVKHPGSLYDMAGSFKTQRVPAFGEKTGRRNVIHMFRRERPEQRRGRPFLMPVIEPLKQLGRYTDAELMAAVVSAMLTVFIKKENPEDGELLETAYSPEEQVSPFDEHSYELGNGMMVGMAPGESIETVNPLRPNSQFDPFWQSMVRQIGAGLNLPFEVVLKYFSASYSASRGALLEAWRVFSAWRGWNARIFCAQIYAEFLTEGVIKGRISAPGFLTDPLIRAAYCGGEWVGPAQGHIDQEKEARAAKTRVEEGFSTREREAMEISGMGFEEISRQRSKEEAMRQSGGWVPTTTTKETVVSEETDNEKIQGA